MDETCPVSTGGRGGGAARLSQRNGRRGLQCGRSRFAVRFWRRHRGRGGWLRAQTCWFMMARSCELSSAPLLTCHDDLHHPPRSPESSRKARSTTAPPPPPPPRTKWTRRVPHSVLIGHAATPASRSRNPCKETTGARRHRGVRAARAARTLSLAAASSWRRTPISSVTCHGTESEAPQGRRSLYEASLLYPYMKPPCYIPRGTVERGGTRRVLLVRGEGRGVST
jgi:hypothetical protein